MKKKVHIMNISAKLKKGKVRKGIVSTNSGGPDLEVELGRDEDMINFSGQFMCEQKMSKKDMNKLMTKLMYKLEEIKI